MPGWAAQLWASWRFLSTTPQGPCSLAASPARYGSQPFTACVCLRIQASNLLNGGMWLGLQRSAPRISCRQVLGDASIIVCLLIALQAARLVRFCDAFNIPVVTLLLPAPARRRQDVCISAKGKGAHALANLIFAFSEASVPKLTLCLGGKEFSAAAQVTILALHALHAAATALLRICDG